MFKSEPVKKGPALPTDAVEAADELYRKCVELGSSNPILGLALISLAIQYQTGEFGDDVAEFEHRVSELLADVNATHDDPVE